MILRSQTKNGLPNILNEQKVTRSPHSTVAKSLEGKKPIPSKDKIDKPYIKEQATDNTTKIALERPDSMKGIKKDVGDESLYARDLLTLTQKWGNDYLSHGKPFFYLQNRDNNFFAPAHEYTNKHAQFILMNQPTGAFSKFYASLTLCYVEPKSGIQIAIADMRQLNAKAEIRHIVGSLMHFPGGSNESINDDEKCAAIAIAEFCFKSGYLVNKNNTAAEALSNFGDEENDTGYSLGLHMAIDYNDHPLFSFFRDKEELAFSSSMYDGLNPLERSAKKNNQQFFQELLKSVVDPVFIKNLENILTYRGRHFNDGQKREIARQIEVLKVKNSPESGSRKIPS